jgi:hypothetical protein
VRWCVAFDFDRRIQVAVTETLLVFGIITEREDVKVGSEVAGLMVAEIASEIGIAGEQAGPDRKERMQAAVAFEEEQYQHHAADGETQGPEWKGGGRNQREKSDGDGKNDMQEEAVPPVDAGGDQFSPAMKKSQAN